MFKRKKSEHYRRPVGPMLERLEDRCVLSAVVGGSDVEDRPEAEDHPPSIVEAFENDAKGSKSSSHDSSKSSDSHDSSKSSDSKGSSKSSDSHGSSKSSDSHDSSKSSDPHGSSKSSRPKGSSENDSSSSENDLVLDHSGGDDNEPINTETTSPSETSAQSGSDQNNGFQTSLDHGPSEDPSPIFDSGDDLIGNPSEGELEVDSEPASTQQTSAASPDESLETSPVSSETDSSTEESSEARTLDSDGEIQDAEDVPRQESARPVEEAQNDSSVPMSEPGTDLAAELTTPAGMSESDALLAFEADLPEESADSVESETGESTAGESDAIGIASDASVFENDSLVVTDLDDQETWSREDAADTVFSGVQDWSMAPAIGDPMTAEPRLGDEGTQSPAASILIPGSFGHGSLMAAGVLAALSGGVATRYRRGVREEKEAGSLWWRLASWSGFATGVANKETATPGDTHGDGEVPGSRPAPVQIPLSLIKPDRGG